MNKNVNSSRRAPSLKRSLKENGWREFILLLIYAVGLTTIFYLVRHQFSHFLLPLFLSERASDTATGTTEFTGKIAPSKEFKIVAATHAIVKDIQVKIGDRIQPHQPLITLENLETKQKLEQFQQQQLAARQEIDSVEQRQEIAKQQVAELEQKIKNFDRITTLNNQLDVADLRVSLAQLRSQQVPCQQQDSISTPAIYKQAQSQHDGTEKLYSDRTISNTQLNPIKAEMQSQAELACTGVAVDTTKELEVERIKQWQLQHQLKINTQKQQLAEMKGQLKLARWQYRQATQRLEVLRQQWSKFWDKAIPNDLLVVRATDAGVVVSLPVAIGDQIVTGTNLVELAKLDSLKVQVPVSASLIDSLHLGQRAIVRLGAGAEAMKISATVVTINPLPAKNLTHIVEVQFTNFASSLLVGQSAKVRFLPN